MIENKGQSPYSTLTARMGSYTTVTILAYTPVVLLELDIDSQEKADYAKAVRSRMETPGMTTRLFVASSGLDALGKRSRTEQKAQIDKWHILKNSANDNERLEIKVVKDADLPCISFALGETTFEGRSWVKVYDLLMEYRLDMQHDSLFKIGGNSKIPVFYEQANRDGLPSPFWDIYNRLLEQSTTTNFSRWLDDHAGIVPPSPHIAVIRPLAKEDSALDQLLEKQTIIKSIPNAHGYTQGLLPRPSPDTSSHTSSGTNHETEVLLAPFITYGNLEMAKAMASLTQRFASVQHHILMGVAGGDKNLKVGDVVLSQEVIGLCQLDPQLSSSQTKSTYDPHSRDEQCLADIGGRLKLWVRVDRSAPSRTLLNIARQVSRICQPGNVEWKMKFRTYLAGALGGQDKIDTILEDHPRIKHLVKDAPTVRLGGILSSNLNLNDKNIRDIITTSHVMTFAGCNVWAFEMEGRAFMSSLRADANNGRPGIIIRGISDQADGESRGNPDEKQVQWKVAAASATACLGVMLPLLPIDYPSSQPPYP